MQILFSLYSMQMQDKPACAILRGSELCSQLAIVYNVIWSVRR